MYRALYRKYRPKDFSDVCGQPHIVRTLRNQLAEGRLSHAYLFTGSRGTGKTSCAKIFAKAVNCLHPIDGNPCNECEICRGIDDETVLDVTEIDAASNNGVDDIRELRDNIAFAPVAAKYRVYIVDEVHMLSGAAFNALLKTLEEPPEHIIFILATTEVHKLPATILSRCQRFDFRRISDIDIAARLEYVASKEDFTLKHEAALLIGRLSDGAMRDALSLLDVCSTASSDITEQTVLDCAGLSGRAYLADLIRNCIDGNTASALMAVDGLYRKSKDFGRLCTELVEYLRDLMLIKTLRHPEGLLKCSGEELADMQQLAESVKLDFIMHAIDVFESAGDAIRSGATRRTAVESALIKLCNPALDTSAAALLRRISALEAGITSAVHQPITVQDTKQEPEAVSSAYANNETAPEKPHTSVTPPKNEVPFSPAAEKAEKDIPADSVPAKSKPTDNKPVGADSGASDGEFLRWNEILDSLGHDDPMMKAALGGTKAYIQGDFMLLDIANRSFRDMINDQRHRANLKKAIAAVTGRSYRIGPYTAPVKAEDKKADDPLDKLLSNIAASGLNNN